jgi:hypothetical protein
MLGWGIKKMALGGGFVPAAPRGTYHCRPAFRVILRVITLRVIILKVIFTRYITRSIYIYISRLAIAIYCENILFDLTHLLYDAKQPEERSILQQVKQPNKIIKEKSLLTYFQ